MYYSWHFLQQYENVMLISPWSCCHHLLLLTRVILHGGKWWQLPRFISLSKRMSDRKSKRKGILLSLNTELQVREPVCIPTQPLHDKCKSQASPCHRHLAYKMEETPSSQERDEICWEVFAFLAGQTYAGIALSSWQSSSKGHVQVQQRISVLIS